MSYQLSPRVHLVIWLALGSGCSSATGIVPISPNGIFGDDGGPFKVKKVFVIALENQGIATVYGNDEAPFLNLMIAQGGHATMYGDVLPAGIPSEPHYVWMEAGTNAFSDHTFTNDDDATAHNSTSSKDHLVTQMEDLDNPKSWRSYQEGM